MTRSIKEIALESRLNIYESGRLEMFESLIRAINLAGGNSESIVDDILNKEMTVIELIDCLGQNDVRFTCNK